MDDEGLIICEASNSPIRISFLHALSNETGHFVMLITVFCLRLLPARVQRAFPINFNSTLPKRSINKLPPVIVSFQCAFASSKKTLMMSTSSTSFPIVRFYDPYLRAPDGRGRTLETILSWPDSTLEFSHDYIQTLFPLPERSPIDPSAPVINRATFATFRSRPELRSRVREALERICQFYGFQFQQGGEADTVRVERQDGGSFERQTRNWVTRSNHNHLRITRIIRSLRVLGLDKEATAFFDAVKKVHDQTGRIGSRSFMFWRRAMERPLFLAPEDDEDEGMGKDFLYEFEEQKSQAENAKEREGNLDLSIENKDKLDQVLQGETDGTDSEVMSSGRKRPHEGDEDVQLPTPNAPESQEDAGTPTNTLRRTKPKSDEI